VRFVVDKAALGNVFLSVLRFSPVSTIPTMLHTDVHLHVVLSQDKRAKHGTFLKRMPFRKSGERGIEKYFRCFRPYMVSLIR
jgi:hypothetical protein